MDTFRIQSLRTAAAQAGDLITSALATRVLADRAMTRAEASELAEWRVSHGLARVTRGRALRVLTDSFSPTR